MGNPKSEVPSHILSGAPQSEAVMMRWGLIPSWAEGQSASPPPVIVKQKRLADVAGILVEQSTLYSADRRLLCVAADEREVPAAILHYLARPVGIWPRGDMGSICQRVCVIESCSIICVPPKELMMAVASYSVCVKSFCVYLQQRIYLLMHLLQTNSTHSASPHPPVVGPVSGRWSVSVSGSWRLTYAVLQHRKMNPIPGLQVRCFAHLFRYRGLTLAGYLAVAIEKTPSLRWVKARPAPRRPEVEGSSLLSRHSLTPALAARPRSAGA